MSYRLYVQPLKEYSGTKPVEGEILVNTFNGNISIAGRDGELISATKDLKVELDLQKFLLTTASTEFEEMYERFNGITAKLNQQHSHINETLEILNLVLEMQRLLKLEMDKADRINERQYEELVELYRSLAKLNELFAGMIHAIQTIALMNEELTATIDTQRGNPQGVDSEYNSVTEFFRSTKREVKDKVSKQEVREFAEGLVRRVLALRNSNSGIESLTFSYTPYDD